MSNPWRDYQENFRANLPSGVTYNSDVARYFFNNKRFAHPWEVEQYRNYLIKTGSIISYPFVPVDPDPVTGVWVWADDAVMTWTDNEPIALEAA